MSSVQQTQNWDEENRIYALCDDHNRTIICIRTLKDTVCARINPTFFSLREIPLNGKEHILTGVELFQQ